MDNFKNNTIDLADLPKYEEVFFTLMHPNYWKIIVVVLACFFVAMGLGIFLFFYFNERLHGLIYLSLVLYLLLFPIVIFASRLSFKKKAYAFRNHDVLFRYGIIATNTIIIPYNRVQHIVLHEGILSRFFGLARIEIFTAGGSSSDLIIPGIEKEQAEKIKQLLMGKIQKQL